jgi:PKD repeat protein
MRRMSCLLAVVQRSPKGMLGRRLVGAVVVALTLIVTASPAVGATTVPALWTAGGLSAGLESAGQAARIATDGFGNVAVVSGPSGGRDLAVTSYTADGILRWRSTVTPALGTFVGDWVAAAPNGDFVVIGHNQDSHGRPIASTMLRYDSNGTLLWRVDFSGGFFPSVGRLVIDAAGNAYVASSATGSGFFVRKYSPSGALLWSQQDTTGAGYSIASSLALSPDETDVAVTGSISGGATWITAVYDATTGARRWQVAAAEGTFARDVVVDAARVYVTGQGVTGGGTAAVAYFLTVVAYDRATGARLWRKDKKPADGYDGAGLFMAMAPDGSIVVTGQTNRGFLDWYTVAFATTGAVRWEAVRDGGLNTNEVPRGVLVMEDGTTVVTGPGGPNLPDGFIPGVTAGYSPNGTLLWEAFSRLATVWVTALPNGADVCATGGYDALITCWRVSDVVSNQPPTAVMSATPSTGAAPLTVTFDGSRSTDPDGTVSSWAWSFGDGSSGTGPVTTHVYSTPGTYTASLRVTDNDGTSSTTTGSIVVSPLLPPAPSGLKATALTRSSIGLTWTNGSTSQTEVRIERCRGVGCTNFTQVAAVAGTATSFVNTGLTARTTYRYRVRAHSALGDSPYSNIASARTKG